MLEREDNDIEDEANEGGEMKRETPDSEGNDRTVSPFLLFFMPLPSLSSRAR